MLRRLCWFVLLAVAGSCASAAEKLPPGVLCLLEDNGAELLPKLTNPWGDPGEGQVEKDTVFSGESAVKITILQRYCNLIPGWAYKIVEKPKEGEYRYVRFAWKGAGVSGIMLQLHDDKDWHIRYTAGANKLGWTSQMVGEKPPAEWRLMTVDLFKDFGEREIHGIALTMFDGEAGYFDHIYFGRTIAELDAIDATGLAAGGPLKLTEEDVEKHYKQLTSSDASIAYRSFWTLAAGGEPAREALVRKLGGDGAPIDAAKLAEWIKQLDDDDFAIREKASTQLGLHFAAAKPLLEDELRRTTSAEVRTRLETMLKAPERAASEVEKLEQQARRILGVIGERAKK
jgi:hypothetical protein